MSARSTSASAPGRASGSGGVTARACSSRASSSPARARRRRSTPRAARRPTSASSASARPPTAAILSATRCQPATSGTHQAAHARRHALGRERVERQRAVDVEPPRRVGLDGDAAPRPRAARGTTARRRARRRAPSRPRARARSRAARRRAAARDRHRRRRANGVAEIEPRQRAVGAGDEPAIGTAARAIEAARLRLASEPPRVVRAHRQQAQPRLGRQLRPVERRQPLRLRALARHLADELLELVRRGVGERAPPRIARVMRRALEHAPTIDPTRDPNRRARAPTARGRTARAHRHPCAVANARSAAAESPASHAFQPRSPSLTARGRACIVAQPASDSKQRASASAPHLPTTSSCPIAASTSAQKRRNAA